jgi:methyl-accepting chemotaxis protein
MQARFRWLTKHPIQAKYLWIVILAMIAPAAVIGFCLYHLAFNLLAMQMAFPEAIATNITPVIERVNRILWIALPILAFLIAWLAVIISHRFAGPIERLESELDQILTGDRSHRISLRKRDDLRGVVERINRLLEQCGK